MYQWPQIPVLKRYVSYLKMFQNGGGAEVGFVLMNYIYRCIAFQDHDSIPLFNTYFVLFYANDIIFRDMPLHFRGNPTETAIQNRCQTCDKELICLYDCKLNHDDKTTHRYIKITNENQNHIEQGSN